MDPLVKDALRAMETRDTVTLRALLHPYLHWTFADGTRIRGRVNVLAMIARQPSPWEPSSYELRDGQIYRWHVRPDSPAAVGPHHGGS